MLEKYSGRKLFAGGGIKLKLSSFDFMLTIDLMPLWHDYHSFQ